VGHGVRRSDGGAYELADGWGGARNVRLEGNEEQAPGVEVADWTDPQFDPAAGASCSRSPPVPTRP
jgi:hypothetical protein